MGTAKPEVHLMLMRAAEAGEIEVLVQMHADPTRNEQHHKGVQEERESEAFHWALPSVEAEPAEALLIQTGQAHERLRAARRAALRAALLFTSSAPVKQAACKAVSAVQIKIPMLHHHTRDEHKLPADPAVTAFGRLPPSLVRACSIYGQEAQQGPVEVTSPTAETGRGAAVATRVFSADGAETAFTRLPPAPPLHLPFCAHSSGDAQLGDVQRVVGEAYGTRVNQRLPLLLLKRLGNDAAHTGEPQGGAGVNTWLPVVEHVFVIHCIFPEVDGAFATADWQWTPRAQATARNKVHEVNLLGVGRQQCRLGCTWTSLKGLILSGGAFIPHFNLGVSPILQRVMSQHLQLITHIEVALAKESSWAALARREAAARQQRWRARGYFTQEKLAEAERRRLPPQYIRGDPRPPWWEPGSLVGTAESMPGEADDQTYMAWPQPVAQQPQAIYAVLCLCMRAGVCVCISVYACMDVWMQACMYVCVCMYVYSLTQAILSPSHPTARTNEWTAVAYTRSPERAAVFDSIQREFKCVRLRVRPCLSVFLSVFLVCTRHSYMYHMHRSRDPAPSFRNGRRDDGEEKGRGVRMRPALGDPSNMDTPAPPGAARWPSCLHKLEVCLCACARARSFFSHFVPTGADWRLQQRRLWQGDQSGWHLAPGSDALNWGLAFGFEPGLIAF